MSIEQQQGILRYLEQKSNFVPIEELLQHLAQTEEEQNSIRSIIFSLIEERQIEQKVLTEEEAVVVKEKLLDGRLQERVLLEILRTKNDVQIINEFRQGFEALQKLQAVRIINGKCERTEKGKFYESHKLPLEIALENNPEKSEELKKRGIVRMKKILKRFIRLAINPSSIEQTKIREITPEMIQKQLWKNQIFQSYDLQPVPYTIVHGIPHPLIELIEEIRSILLRMGLRELEGSFISLALWNMEVLLVPQDHPARDMQDTFYLGTTETKNIPEKLLNDVARAHEKLFLKNESRWNVTEARKFLLRTHCTVESVKDLIQNKDETNVFCIGKIFRRETIDRTHLPEFHQVDVVIQGGNPSIKDLLMFLKTFYTELGFDQIRFKIAHFPYTEPSLEIEARYREEWIELGGAGLFRPEILQLSAKDEKIKKGRVMALGLGLERLLLLRKKISRLSDIYEVS